MYFLRVKVLKTMCTSHTLSLASLKKRGGGYLGSLKGLFATYNVIMVMATHTH